ncbi:Hypothetical predicted protein, partial [Olea europaea subsp. europaea]
MLMILLCLFITTIDGRRFKYTDPVFYKNSDVIYSTQMKRHMYRVVIVNPCESYFANITRRPEINKQLIKDCDDSFRRIAKLDNCLKNRTKRAVVTGNLTADELYKQSHASVAPSVTARKMEGGELTREKRIIPILGTCVLLVIAGMTTMQMHENEVNISNIKELNKALSKEKEFVLQGYKVFHEVRETIHGINDRLVHLEQRLDRIDSTLETFPKIVALVNNYDNQFRDLNEYLSNIDNAAAKKRVSLDIFKLASDNIWQEANPDHANLEKCEENLNNDGRNLVFDYMFTMPHTDHKIKILSAESFRFWNRTSPERFCWMKYAGPRYVMVNTSNSCQLDVQEYWVTEKRISGHPCLQTNKQLERKEQVYHADTCFNKPSASQQDIQVKLFNGFYKIYCFGSNITIDKETVDCPEKPFELPISQKFELGGETYDLGEESIVTINPVEQHLNNEITDRLNIDEIKIYGVNTTGLDYAFEKLSSLTDSVKEKVKLIESPIPKWLTSPFKSIGGAIGKFFAEFSWIISIVASLVVFIILFPVLEIGLLFVKFGYKAVSALATPLLNHWTRTRSRFIRSRARRRF